MKPHDLFSILQTPDSTVRKYARDYAEYLSPAATGGGGRHREYTEMDARVLKLVIDMKRQNLSNADIEATLSSLQASNWERLPALDDSSAAIIPSPTTMIEVQTDRAVMQREIELLREQLDQKDDAIKAERADREELLQRLHRAETMLELYESGRLHPPTQGS